MAREIPELVRAAAGLAATVLDEARKLPEALPGLPVRLIGLAMQRAMRIQQHYVGFVARGDELFTGLRGADEPGLATFDDEPAPGATSGGFRESAFDRVDDLPLAEMQPEDELIEAQLLEVEVENARNTVELLAEEAPSTDALLEEVLDDLAIEDLVEAAPQAAIPVESALPATKPTAKNTAPAKKAASEKKAPAPSKKAPGKQATPPALAPEPAPAPTPTPTPAPTPTPSAPSLPAPAPAPIDGYDFFSLAQLRGHLRGYATPTVEQLLAYEKAGLGREPYLRMLRNRLERLRAESA